jgi:TolA-binding protein
MMRLSRFPLLRRPHAALLLALLCLGGARAENASPAPAANAEAATAVASEAASNEARPKRAENEAQGLLRLGASFAERREFESAEIAYRQVLAMSRIPEGDVKTALLGLAHLYRRQGALTKAAAIYERFLKDYPGDERTPDALLELGRTLRSLGVYKLALGRFYSVLNSTLKLPGEGFDRYQLLAKTAQFEIAETHFQAGEFEDANKYYTRLQLLELAPVDRARAHFKSGYSLHLHGDLDAGVRTLRAFVEQWPQDDHVPEARYLLAISLRKLNRPQEALVETMELLRTEKSRVEADPARWAYWQRKTGNHLANEFFETGDTLNARAIYAGLLDLGAEPTWRLPISYQIGLCNERLGAIEGAIAAYRAIVETAGPSPAPELLELATMAKWRLEHLEWRDRVGHQLSRALESAPPPAATTAQTESSASPASATP